MAPQVRKVKSAFLYYQGEELKRVRDELGVSMGEAMTEVRELLAFDVYRSDGLFNGSSSSAINRAAPVRWLSFSS
jgi:hypothetical protein